jgi:hypothetical protein
MVLVEGDKADGVTVDHDAFEITAADGSATTRAAADQVVEAILGTKESAATGGHQLKTTGVTWSDHAEGAALRDALAANGLDDVLLVSEGHAAAALAQAVGRAVGYDTTALLFIDRDTATLSVVQTDDGSVVKVLTQNLHSDDAMAVLTNMAAAVDEQQSPPQGMFVVGSGVDVSSVKAHLEHLVRIPVSAPDEPELALARGAALAAANAPALEASTVGLAYSQDPDGTTAGSAYAALAAAETQLAPVDDPYADGYEPRTDLQVAEGERKPFLLVGSAMASIFVVGVVALVISLAVSIRPTADQRPSPAESAIAPSVPSAIAPTPAPAPEAAPVVAPPPAPPAETIKAPVPVVQEAPVAPPPRTVYVEQPAAPPPQAPPPAAPAPPPAAPPPAPVPVAPVLPAPAPAYIPPSVYNPWNPYNPGYYPQPQRPWTPPRQENPWNPWPQRPQEPQAPQIPDVPQAPWQNGGSSHGSYGSGESGDSGSRRSGGYGSGGHGGGGCFLIFCSGGH